MEPKRTAVSLLLHKPLVRPASWLWRNRNVAAILLRFVMSFLLLVQFCIPSLISPIMWAGPSWSTLRDQNSYQDVAVFLFFITALVVALLWFGRPHSVVTVSGFFLAAFWYFLVVYSLVTAPNATAWWTSGTGNYGACALLCLLGGTIEGLAWLERERLYPFRA
jgi:hypothetical protein